MLRVQLAGSNPTSNVTKAASAASCGRPEGDTELTPAFVNCKQHIFLAACGTRTAGVSSCKLASDVSKAARVAAAEVPQAVRLPAHDVLHSRLH